MAPGKDLALRRVLGGDEHRPLGVCRKGVRDAAEESAPDRASPPLPAHNQSGVDLFSDLIDRRGHRFVGPRGPSGGVVATPAGTRGALFGNSFAIASSCSSISPSFGTATTNEPARANCTAAGIQTTNTTASAGLISSAAAVSAVLEPSDPS